MNVLVEAEVLVVGIDGLNQCLRRLPVSVTWFNTGREAVSSLKNKHYDAVVSRWNLPDLSDGRFLQGLRLIKPDICTIAFVDSSDVSQEIQARSIGVNAVLTEKTNLLIFNQTLASMINVPVLTGETIDSSI